jgi:phosphoribosylformylglycinamidine cyclo-ligase
MRKYDTIGIDCVAMCANDLICTGAEPISFLDYIAMAKHDSRLVEDISVGLVEGAKHAGMAIVGGETAVVRDLFSSDSGLDLVGMAAGICSEEDLILGDEIRRGDVLIGVASSGVHSNGLSLARKILLKEYKLGEMVPELGRSVGEELLEPTRIYVKPVLEAIANIEIHGLAHITGGSFAKLERVVGQAKLGVRIEQLPPTPPIFQLIQKLGPVSEKEMRRTFNMGIGFVLVCPENQIGSLSRIFKKYDYKTVLLGRIQKKRGVWIEGQQIR